MSDDTIKIFGFGTLVLEDSARITCPNLTNFQSSMVKNSVRIFGKVNLRAAYRGDVNWDDMKVASCFLADRIGYDVIGVTFDIPITEWPLMRSREIDYDCRVIDVFDLNGNPQGQALTFYGYPDDEAFLEKMSEGDKVYLKSRRKGYEGQMYRQGIFPGDDYLEKCFRAYNSAGDKSYQNFLDTSLLADNKTTLREYLD